MNRPPDGAVLDWWESARTHAPLERALHLLTLFVDAPADAIADWPIGRRDRALLAARAMLVGAEIKATAACPSCATEVEAAFDAAAVTVSDPAGGEAVLANGVRLRAATSRDLATALASPDPRRALAEACVTGKPPRKWTDAMLAEAAAALQALDPQADIRLRLACAECGTAWSAPLFVEPFLWREMTAWAGARFDEVHALARAYGWSEAEILALPQRRRRTYLERAQAA